MYDTVVLLVTVFVYHVIIYSYISAHRTTMDADKAARGVDSVTDNYVEKESAVNVNVSSFDSTIKQEKKVSF